MSYNIILSDPQEGSTLAPASLLADLPTELQPDSSGLAAWQPRFAEMGVPIFPVTPDKKPVVRGYLTMRLPQAKIHACGRFAGYEAFGIACGPVSGVTVLDIDSTDENHVADAMGRHGETPLVVRTQSGGHHLYYRHDGETRRIRPWDGLPVDQLGEGGFVVAPPSKGMKGVYRIIAGTLDDLAALPVMENACRSDTRSDAMPFDHLDKIVGTGMRNRSLFKEVMRNAHHCDDLATLLDKAETLNDGMFLEPLDDAEVKRIAGSAWKYTVAGTNRVGQHGAWFTQKQLAGLVQTPHLMAMVGWLMGQNRPDSEGFLVADAARPKFFPEWSRERFAKTRTLAVETGWITMVRRPRTDKAALYQWGPERFAG